MQDPSATGTPSPGHTAHHATGPTGRTNGKAEASLIFGILAWVLWFIPLVAAILAIALGNKARQEILDLPARGSGLAMAGTVLGWIYITFFVLVIIVMILVGGFTALIRTVTG